MCLKAESLCGDHPYNRKNVIFEIRLGCIWRARHKAWVKFNDMYWYYVQVLTLWLQLTVKLYIKMSNSISTYHQYWFCYIVICSIIAVIVFVCTSNYLIFSKLWYTLALKLRSRSKLLNYHTFVCFKVTDLIKFDTSK